jgi:hypothetical protein
MKTNNTSGNIDKLSRFFKNLVRAITWKNRQIYISGHIPNMEQPSLLACIPKLYNHLL